MALHGYWRKTQVQRISRRRLLGAAGVGAAGLAVAAACGDGGGPAAGGTPAATGAPAGEPVYGGRFRAARSAVYDTIDPHKSVASLGVFADVYNVLLKQSAVDPDQIFLDLAMSFENPEPTEWIFNIRPGVAIPPNDLGVPERDMDAQDAYESFERIRGLPEALACAFVCPWFDSHEAPDPQTYIIRTPTPYAWFLFQIGGTNYFQSIPPRELIADPDKMQSGGVGGGAFSIRPGSYSESEGLILDKNPVYYRTDPDHNNNQLPYVDGVDTIVVPDSAAVRVAFESKQTYTYAAANRAEVDELLASLDVREANARALFNYVSFTMNVEREPWNDPRVRKAAMHAINRQEYIDIIYGGDAKPNGIVHWPVGAYALPDDEREELQGWDPELSKQLIRDAGHELPLKIEVVFPTGDFLEMDQHFPIWLIQMEDAGFQIEQVPMDLGSWISRFTEVDYASSLHPGLEYETPEFPLDFQHSDGPGGSGIFSKGLQDPEVDAAIERTKIITDPEELVNAIHDVQRLIYERGPVALPIVSPFSRTLVWNFVQDWPSGSGTIDLIDNSWWLDGAPS